MKFVLAPLAGFTDAPFRRLCAEGGADLVYTEMVSAAGLAHGSSPTRHLMETMPGEGPVACQIFGSRESDVAFAAREAAACRADDGSPRFVEINLNAGCPMAKVTREGAGAKLAEDPERVYRLLKAMVENTDLPVTLKTRLGPHPRRRTVFELLDADELAEVVRRAKIPVTGNGSVVDAKSAAAMAATGVDAIMVGRASLAAPAIFAALKSGGDVRRAACGERNDVVRRHLGYLLEFRRQLAERFPNDHIPSEDAFTSVKMHVHLFRYFNGRPGAAALRARLNSVRTLAEIRAAIQNF